MTTAFSNWPLYTFFFFIVRLIFGYTSTSILAVSLAALLIRRRRRVLSASVATLAWVVVITGSICAVALLANYAIPLCVGNPYEKQFLIIRAFGSHWLSFWLGIVGSVIAPQFFWLRRSRTNPCISLFIAVAIVTPSAIEASIRYAKLYSELLPKSWAQ